MIKRLHSVLLVEDDHITNFLNERLIKKLNITENIAITSNGAEALKYIETAQKENLGFPDLIFLDINMPVMDGFDFLKKFDALSPAIRNNSIVVMLTTSTNSKDMDNLLYSSNTDFLSKPLTEDKIISIMHKYFSAQSYRTA